MPEAAKNALKDATAKDEMIQKLLNADKKNQKLKAVEPKKINVKNSKKNAELPSKLNLETNMDTIE